MASILDVQGTFVRTATQRVPPDWIDYNGHMNVAYYTMAFDKALDDIFDALGIGAASAHIDRMGPMALQCQIHYIGELLEGTRFACDFLLLDADPKRVHLMLMMRNLDKDEALAATYENLSLNVDLDARKSAPYPPAAYEKIQRLLAAQVDIPRPAQVGARLGIRRKG